MAKTRKTFECLRCEHTYPLDYDPRAVVERSCPKCGSNSVRLQAVKKPAPKAAAG